MNRYKRAGRWIAAAAATTTLAACGGGGGGDSSEPVPDARNGNYTMLAANAQVYTLALDFDAKSFAITGAGMDKKGTIAADGSGAFLFNPGNSTGTTGTNTLRFSHVDDTVVGGFAFNDGVAPFLASRSFVRSVTEIAGVYNMLGRTVDRAGPENTTIQQGEVTPGGQLRLCNDNTIYTIAACPETSVAEGTVTVSGDLFSAVTPAGTIQFRVAKIGDDKIFLRASASAGTTRRFVIGTPVDTRYAPATFTGFASEGTWGTFAVTASTYASDAVDPRGNDVTIDGTVTAIGLAGGTGPGGLISIDTTAPRIGTLFSIRSGRLGVMAAARNSMSAAGLFAIGLRQ